MGTLTLIDTCGGQGSPYAAPHTPVHLELVTSPEHPLTIAMRLYMAGEHGKAIRFYRLVLSEDPGNALAYFMLGIALKEVGEDDRAHDSWLAAAAVGDADTDADCLQDEAPIPLLQAA